MKCKDYNEMLYVYWLESMPEHLSEKRKRLILDILLHRVSLNSISIQKESNDENTG